MAHKVTVAALVTTAIISAADAQLKFLGAYMTPGQFQIAVAVVLLATVAAEAWLNHQRGDGHDRT